LMRYVGMLRLDPRIVAAPTVKKLAKVCSRADSQALDLLSRMLKIEPSKRISVTDALQHPFFQQQHEDGGESRTLLESNEEGNDNNNELTQHLQQVKIEDKLEDHHEEISEDVNNNGNHIGDHIEESGEGDENQEDSVAAIDVDEEHNEESNDHRPDEEQQ